MVISDGIRFFLSKRVLSKTIIEGKNDSSRPCKVVS
jgi:hypothetical protein